ncbi:oligosaccharide flippase family protein [Ruegeria atlantica]|uniref:oligosaccharide flippase family protein n=1 Tax=Ruegeria atlantica TaxID=81569 RepID=UPI0014803148|nr:oligosaccharide flippase family protein [Ruegeria atlantica]
MTWFFVPRVLSAVFAIAILMVMTKVLGPAEFGRYNLTLLVGTILFSFSFLWLVIAIARFHHAKEFEGRTIATVMGASVVLAFFLVVLSSLVTLVLPGEWVENLKFAAIFCISHGMHELGAACLRQYHEGPKYAAVTLLRHAIGVALAVGFILNGGGYESAVIGMSIGAAVTGGYALLIAFRRSGIVVPKLAELKTYLSFGFPLAIVSSSATFFAMFSQSILAILAGMESVGYFAAAQSLAARTLRLPMGTLSRVIGPSVFEAQEVQGKASSDAVLYRYFSFLMLISMPILAVLIFSADVFANLLFEPAFADQTAGYIRILTLSSFVFGLQGAYLSFAFTRSKKTVLQLIISVTTLLGHAAISYLFIYWLGAKGAAYAFLVSAILSFLVYFQYGRRIDRISIPLAEFGKALAGLVAFAPLGLWANASTGLMQQFAILALGLTIMFVALLCVGQTAALAVVRKLKRHLLIGGFPSSK